MWMSFHQPLTALNHWFLDILLKDMESIILFLMVLSDYLSGPHIRLKKWAHNMGSNVLTLVLIVG